MDSDIELGRASLRILLKHGKTGAAREIVNESLVLERELVVLIKDEDEILRVNAIRTLAMLENRKKYFEQIKDALTDSSHLVRTAAVRSIIRIDKKKSRPLLLELLDKEQDNVVILPVLESLKDVGELKDILTIARFLEVEAKYVPYEASAAIQQINSRHWKIPILERLRRYLIRMDKLTFGELCVFIGIFIVGIFIWKWDLEQTGISALIVSYLFRNFRSL